MSTSVVGWMPIATPQGIRSRVPPSAAESGTPRCFAARSHIAISVVALAIGCSRIQPSRASTSSGPARSAPRSVGRMTSSRAYHTVFGVSPEYHGSSGATLSPQPTAPPSSTRARTCVSCVSREPLVSYACFSGSRTTKSSTRSALIRAPHPARSDPRGAAAARAGMRRGRRSIGGTPPPRSPRRTRPRMPRAPPRATTAPARDRRASGSGSRRGPRAGDASPPPADRRRQAGCRRRAGGSGSRRVRRPRVTAGGQLVRHIAIEVAVVFARERAELRQAEARVQRLERVHRPAHHFDALIQAVIALRLLQREREAGAAMLAPHGEHVRMVTEVVVVDAQEPEDEPRRAVVSVDVAEPDEAAVVDHREQELRRNDDVAAPHLLLDRDRERARHDVASDLDTDRHGVPSIGPLGYAAAAWRRTTSSS